MTAKARPKAKAKARPKAKAKARPKARKVATTDAMTALIRATPGKVNRAVNGKI